MFDIVDMERAVAKIKVIGVGGGGGNAINSMIAANLFGVEFIAVNTDNQHLDVSMAGSKLRIGKELTKGLGAGSNPAVGRQAALEDKDNLLSCIEGADMVFITAGMGGGTGTGAAPVIASLAREMGILTVGVVTRPFYYEGRRRALNAEEGIRELKKHVDTLIVIPNDRIHMVVEKGTPLLKSFSIANDVLRQAIQGISDLILVPGLINLDFADVKTVMEGAGKAVIGVGTGTGDNAAFEAAKKAISNPLLEESSIEGAKGILINITGGVNISLDSVQDASSLIHDSSHDEANIIIGAVINTEMEDEVRVTVIATGLEEKVEKAELPQIKKWTPRKDPISLKGSDRILSKSMDSQKGSSLWDEQAEPAQPAQPETAPETAEAPPEPPKEMTPPRLEEPAPVERPVERPLEIREQQPPVPEPEMPSQTEDIFDIPTFLRKRLGDRGV